MSRNTAYKSTSETDTPAVGGTVAAVLAASRKRFILLVVLMVAGVVATAIVCNMVGVVSVAPDKVVRIVMHNIFGWGDATGWSPQEGAIIWQIRFPRVVAGLVIGAGMSVVGMVIQAMVRNPIADPYIIGASSGASLGAIIVIVIGGVVRAAVPPALGAIVGALVALIVVFALSRGGGRLSSIRLLLIGVAMASAFSSMGNFFLYAAEQQGMKNQILFWMLGGLASVKLREMILPFAVLVVMIGYLWSIAGRLDALAMGDETATALGVDPHRLRTQLLIVSAVFIGAAVSVAGPIGFLGLVVPHIARMIVGATHARVLIASTLLGAIYLALVDLASRLVLQPVEIPVGIMTALLGTPVFVWLIRRDGSRALREST